MPFFCVNPAVFHGGGDEVNDVLARLSWKELALGFGIVLAVFLIILIAEIAL